MAQSLLFYWRRQAWDGQLGPRDSAPVLIPVAVGPSEVMAPVALDDPASRRHSLIEIELGGGRLVRVDADVDADALQRVLGVLELR